MRRVIYLFFTLMFLLPINICACIITFYQQEPLIYEISHRSIAIYDRESQKVGLIPQISFRGKLQDFCVVVPTPTVPKLNTVSKEVFYEAERLTASVRRERGAGCLFNEDIIGGAEEKEVSKDIDVLSEQSVGVFDAVTLSATDPNALVNWLQENKYKFSVEDKDVIDYYIQRKWVFTVMKINALSMPSTSDYYYNVYNINPVMFRYSANSLIYPMRLASINAGDKTDVVTYVLSDGKMTFPGAKIEYANNINDRELKKIIEWYPAFGGLIGQNRYLTKLRRTFTIMEMDTDVEIVPAPDNKEFEEIVFYGISPIADLIPLGIVAILFLGFRLLNERKKHRGSNF